MKRIQLKEMIRKNMLTENSALSYADAFQDYLFKKYKGKSVNGYKFDWDNMSGTVIWSNDKYTIYATPFWEDNAELPIDVMDSNSDEVLNVKLVFVPVFDMKKDEITYFKLLSNTLKKLK